MSEEQRACLGSVYRIAADFLKERGLTEAVISQLPPESRRMIERPPFSFGWQDYKPLEEIEKTLYARSPELPADLGRAAAQHFSGTIVAPVIKLAATLFGSTPESIFGNLDRFFSIVIRGFSFRYEPHSPLNGRVIVTIKGGPVHPAIFQQLRGNLHVTYEVCTTTGMVGEPEVLRSDASGAEVAYAVQWD